MRHAIFALSMLVSTQAFANAKNVGLGVAVGGAYSPSTVKNGDTERDVGAGFAWGFFVDIPLLDTFYISPASMLYTFDLGNGAEPVTDVDLNFKFIVPIGDLHVGAGVTAGLTSAAAEYRGHYGALGYLSYNLVANLDAFLLAQYKRFEVRGEPIDDLHGYIGGMFRF
jgi:hypothetical protein